MRTTRDPTAPTARDPRAQTQAADQRAAALAFPRRGRALQAG